MAYLLLVPKYCLWGLELVEVVFPYILEALELEWKFCSHILQPQVTRSPHLISSPQVVFTLTLTVLRYRGIIDNWVAFNTND